MILNLARAVRYGQQMTCLMAMIFNFSKSAKLKGAEKLKEADINCEISVLIVTTEKDETLFNQVCVRWTSVKE